MVSIERAAGLPFWASRKTQKNSIGKAIRRLENDLSNLGLGIFFSKEREHFTDWQLTTDALSSATPEILSTVSEIVAEYRWRLGDRFSNSAPADVAYWMNNSVESLLKLTEGNAKASLDFLQKNDARCNDEGLKEITAVHDARVRSRLGGIPELPAVSIGRDMKAFEVATAARKLASEAVRSRSKDWEAYSAKIYAALPMVQEKDYTTTTAVLLNALAVIDKRRRQFTDALVHIKEAAPLAFFSGDLILIQQVVFNFSNILWENWKINPTVCSQQDYLDLLELDITIRQRHKIGFDSAQAELLAAFFRVENNDLEEASNYLNLARPIIRKSRQMQDYAFYYRVAGLLRGRFGTSEACRIKGYKRLLMSARYYDAVGNEEYHVNVMSEAEEARKLLFAQ